jgi:CHAT domain-containing protein/uncharacterized protein HemY
MSPSSVFGRRAPRPRGVVSFCVLLALVLGGASGAPPPAPPELKDGTVVERDLKGGETHVYPVDLQAGQFLRVTVQEKGIDVEVVLLDPQGAFVTGSDWLSLGAKQSLEDFSAIAETPGRYLLDVRSGSKVARPGRYQLNVAELRLPKGPEETLRSRAGRAVWDGFHASPAESVKAPLDLEKAIGLWEQLGENRRMAEALFGLGDLHAAHPDARATAAKDYLRSAALWREQTDPEAKSWRSSSLNRAGNLLKSMGRLDDARKAYEEAASISGGLGDASYQAASLSNLGQLALEQGEVQRGISFLQESLLKAREAGDRFNQAKTLGNLGSAYNQIAEEQSALRSHQESLALARALPNTDIEATAENNLGDTYLGLADWDSALKHFRQALPIVHRLGKRAEEAKTLINIGVACLRSQRFTEAQSSLDQALTVARSLKDRETEGLALSYQASLLVSLKQPASALTPAEEALRMAQGFPEREMTALLTLGKVHRDLGRTQEARKELERALTLARERGDPLYQANLLLTLAKLERDHGDPTLALNRARQAVDTIEAIRTRVLDQRLRTSFLAAKQEFYEVYVDTLMPRAGGSSIPDQVAAALAVAERARARSLLDILTESGTDIHADADPALIEREHRLRDEVNSRDAFRFKLLAGEKPDRRQLKDVERKLADALAEYGQVQADLKASSPAYTGLTQPQPLSVAEIQAQVLDGKALLLEYALGEKRSFLWAVTPDSVRSFQLPERTRIERLARRYYDLLTARNQRPHGETLAAWKQRIDKADVDAERIGRDLSRLLLGPVERLLGDRPLLIVADGALQYIPFGALPVSSKGIPLAARHDVVSLPSASALAVLRRDVRGRAQAPKALAIFGDPVFQATDERLASIPGKHRPGKIARMALAAVTTRGGWNPGEPRQEDEEHPAFRRLPSSAREAQAIAALVPPDQRLLALGFDASRAMALSPELAQYRDLHFATHGVLDSRRPELSKLVLSLYDARGKPEDGFLRLNDIYNLRLDADLVVLSACRTALGQEIRGEGLVGLTRGFMYAGAARVLASLWSVEDRATADLMTTFYRNRLRQGLSPAAALRRAQLEIASQPGRKSPYYWAGFSLQGEWR